MKIVLESQKEFLQGQNQVALTNANQGQTLNINMNFDLLAEKLKEVGSSFKQMVGTATGNLDSQGNMKGFAERGDFMLGLLEGFGLDSLAGAYTNKQVQAEQKATFVKNFEDENKELPITKETLREIAKEAFRETKESITYQNTETVQPMEQGSIDFSSSESLLNKENILETEQTEDKRTVLAEDSSNYLMELTSEAKTYYPFIQETSKDMKELKEFIMANWSDVGGGGISALPGGGGNKKGAATKAPKPGGKVSGTAKVLGGGAGVLAKVATPLAIGMSGVNIYQNEQAVESGALTREEATKENTKEVAGTATGLGGAVAGAKLGAILGAMTGPAAPLAIPILSVLGGFAGFFGGDKLGRAVAEDVMSTDNTEGMLDPESSLMLNAVPSTSSMVSDMSNEVSTGKAELSRVISQIQANPIDQTITNNVSSQTTVINARKQVAPGNPDPTFLRFTDKNSAPR